MTRSGVVVLAMGVSAGIVAMGCVVVGIRVNLSASLPRGIYRVVAGAPQSAPVRGTIVLVCLPARVAAFARGRSYLPQGGCAGHVMPVGKVVAGRDGDTVTMTARGVVVDGQSVPFSAVLDRDSQGRWLGHVPYGTYVLGRRAVWLAGRSIKSFDSKIFGPVDVSQIQAELIPVWTESGEYWETTIR